MLQSPNHPAYNNPAALAAMQQFFDSDTWREAVMELHANLVQACSTVDSDADAMHAACMQLAYRYIRDEAHMCLQ